MEFILFCIMALVAYFSVMLVLEPFRFLPESKPKMKRVGASYWGVYVGSRLKESEEERTIEVKQPSRKETYIVGSSTYAQGRGVKMSGRG